MTDYRPPSDDVPGAEDAERFIQCRGATAAWFVHLLADDAAGQRAAWASLVAACDELIPANAMAKHAAVVLPQCADGAVTMADLVANLQHEAAAASWDGWPFDCDGPGA